ncbi:hypothetical protein SOVF_189990 [Spinacia oleracea]|nr:hypothetical protein SOVF_189990 [Spinacia oleracea]
MKAFDKFENTLDAATTDRQQAWQRIEKILESTLLRQHISCC